MQPMTSRLIVPTVPTSGNVALPPITETTPQPPLTAHQLRITDNLSQLLDVLPPPLRTYLEQEDNLEDLLEIVMDLGRIPEARFAERALELGILPITAEDIEYVTGRVGAFGKDNRAGIERTLHRISAIRNRQGKIVGLTCRIGRAVYGTIDIIQDVVESGKSILMLGRPGRGKTTKLREVARILSEELKKRVVIVDTSNEIAGDGDIPHPAIGRARRMQVATPEDQHHVMIEAVENHMPEVIVIDEIGTEQEAFAARTIAERGVQLVGTAHGNSLENLMMNPTLSDLVGGIHAVTLSDDEAKRRGTQKTVLERKAPPTFDVVIEIMEVDKLALHLDVERTVDKLLRGTPPRPEIRIRNESGEIEVIQKADESHGIRELPDRTDYRNTRNGRVETHETGERNHKSVREKETRTGSARPEPAGKEEEEDAEIGAGGPRLTPRAAATINSPVNTTPPRALPTTVRIFPYGVSRSRLDRAIAEGHLPAYIARDVSDADVVIALKATYKREPGKMREANQKRLPIYVVRSNTYAQIANCIREIFGLKPAPESEEEAMEDALWETQEAIDQVKQTNEAIELSPANSYTRRLQHQLVERYQLTSESVGVEPQRRVRILPLPV
ncbi:MAG TPA: R3H domain-containing nucleic acid-binding protein [Chthonomonadaceae bacterium]|nr:R3H domain-containing nucleic acid-binding protein [Chthonomonadaceae bacterium]